jgi:hypothetical protein
MAVAPSPTTMIYPVIKTLKVLSTDSFELRLNWKDPDGDLYQLSTFTGFMKFFVSKTDRTVVKSVTNGVSGSRIVLANTSPNIYVRIIDTETQVGTLPDFTQTPGYYLLDLSPTDAEITYRLMQGNITYVL